LKNKKFVSFHPLSVFNSLAVNQVHQKQESEVGGFSNPDFIIVLLLFFISLTFASLPSLSFHEMN